MMKDSHRLFLRKLKEICLLLYSFMVILINSLHLKDGLRDLEPQSQSLRMKNCMAEEEQMMDTPHMEQCWL